MHLTRLTYTYTIYSHTTGHWCKFFYVPQEPDSNENAVRLRNLRFFVLIREDLLLTRTALSGPTELTRQRSAESFNLWKIYLRCVCPMFICSRLERTYMCLTPDTKIHWKCGCPKPRGKRIEAQKGEYRSVWSWRLLVNTGTGEYYSLLHTLDYSRKRLISKLKNDMQVRKPEK